MDTKLYETSEHFERNRAIYVLCNIDGAPLDYVALNFNLSVDEVREIVTLHERYEGLLR